jgi:type I restriction enzyme S subunit
MEEVVSGFACGERDPNGVIQLRMNNIDTRGNFVWTDFLRVPVSSQVIGEYALQVNDVLFNNTNSIELVGKSALFRGHCEAVVFSNHFTRLRPNRDALLPPFLAAWLLQQWQLGVFENICNRWIGQSAVKPGKLLGLKIPLPPLSEQKRIAAILNEQMAAVERARKVSEEQTNAAELYPFALVRESLKGARPRQMPLGDCLDEVRAGDGAEWSNFPDLGETRRGLALAKDPVGKNPERYKAVAHGTVFYNPMRILLGSISMVDETDRPGITSPDYVVVRGKEGVLDTRWFYYWFRSPFGAHLIESLSRGSVRERILFNRLAEGVIEVPPIEVQREASAKMRHIAGAKGLIYTQLDTITALPAALLQRAFNGEL